MRASVALSAISTACMLVAVVGAAMRGQPWWYVSLMAVTLVAAAFNCGVQVARTWR